MRLGFYRSNDGTSPTPSSGRGNSRLGFNEMSLRLLLAFRREMMGILSVINRNLLHNSKSKLKSLSRPSNPCLSGKTQVCAPTFGGDLNKHMFLIQHYKEDTNLGAFYSLVSIKEKSWKLEYYEIPGHRIPSGHLHVGCNGLYLSVVYQRGSTTTLPEEHLWNPITNEIKALAPPGPSYLSNRSVYCDTYGLGFDPESNDYKVIRFLRFDLPDDTGDMGTLVEIYSLNSDSWREIAYPLTCCAPSVYNSVCINDIYYGATYFDGGDANAILSFDFANEEFSPDLIPLPEKVRPTRGWDQFFSYCLAEYDGALAVILHSETGRSAYVPPLSFEVRVWNGESWTPRESTDTIVVDVPGGVYKVLGLFQKDKLFLQAFEGELLLFDCKTRVLEYLGIHAAPWLLNVFPHLRCFVSLHPK